MKTSRLLVAGSALLALAVLTGPALAQECAAPKPEWLFCDDFESQSDQNGQLGLWEDQGLGPQNLVMGTGAANVHGGTRSLQITAHKGKDTGGGPTKWFPGKDEIYVRFWTRFAADYHYLHHMVFIGASEASNKWSAMGTAGCRPNGSNFFVTQIEPFSESDRHPPPGAWGFYTYSTDMQCDPGASCANYADPAQICSDCATLHESPCQNGLECCWGTNNITSPTVSPPLGAWTCVEGHVQANTGSQSNGVQTLFIDGKQVGTWAGIRFRTDDALKINSLGLWHYVTDDVYAAGQTEETLWFDDVVVSTAPIGCGAGASGPVGSGGAAGSGSGGTSAVASGGVPTGSGGVPRGASGSANGGSKSTVDAGSARGDAGATKTGAAAKDAGGCGCRAARRPADGSALAVVALVSALVLRRRRRSQLLLGALVSSLSLGCGGSGRADGAAGGAGGSNLSGSGGQTIAPGTGGSAGAQGGAGSGSGGVASTGGASNGGTSNGGAAGSSGWVPPLGIPNPGFGIEDRAPPTPSPWSADAPGFGYVDNTHAAATDDANPFGSPARPRLTIPRDLPAGTVIEVHSGPYAGGGITITGTGTAARPVYVRGADRTSRPVLSAPVEVTGSYLVLEELDFDGPESSVSITGASDHVTIRHSEVHDGVGGPSAGIGAGRWSGETDPTTAHHLVLYDVRIHDNGDWSNPAGDQDHHGVGLGHHVDHVWLLDSELFHNSGDGIQINGKIASLGATTHHIYVGRNTSYENKQTGFWTKQATDVVFSQNTAHTHRPSASSGGACMGYQYGPERVWFLFNHLYDCEVGITASTDVGDVDGVAGTGKDVYVLGNVIHDIHTQAPPRDPDDPWEGGAAIRFTDETATRHVVDNTIYGADAGIAAARGTGPLSLSGNLLLSVAGGDVILETAEAAATSTMDHGFFESPARIDWGDTAALALAAFRSRAPTECAHCLEGTVTLVDPAGGNFQAKPGSPTIDASATAPEYATFQSLYGIDLSVAYDGAARPRGAAPDIGAFEQ